MGFRVSVDRHQAVYILLMSGFFLGACGDSEHSDNHRTVTRPTITKVLPKTYNLHDEECLESEDKVIIKRTAIWGWEGFNVVSATTPLTDTASQESLYSPIVSSTRFSRKFVRTCRGPSEFNCYRDDGSAIGYVPPTEDKRLKVCRDNYPYPRDTYESGALTSVHYLNQAAATYDSAMPVDLRSIKLEVFPLFESLFTDVTDANGNKVNERKYIADNLAYYPGHDMIVVFPQSRALAKEGFDRFWESSFVLAHELGHHIEEVHIGPEVRRMLGLTWDPLLHAYASAQPLIDSDHERQATLGRFWTSVSEAFADLNAYYAGHEDVSTLVNVDCLGANRNVSAELFADGTTPKRLSEDVVHQFLFGFGQINYCNGVNFNEPHIVGALLAYVMQRVIGILTPATAATTSEEINNQRYRLSIAWIKAMLTAHRADDQREFTPSTLFNPLTGAIEKISAKATNSQKRAICTLADDLLPVLEHVPFAQYCQDF